MQYISLLALKNWNQGYQTNQCITVNHKKLVIILIWRIGGLLINRQNQNRQFFLVGRLRNNDVIFYTDMHVLTEWLC